MIRSLVRHLTAVTAALATAIAGALVSLALATPAQAANRVTPGDFTGYGFDQCVAPTQREMNQWMRNSPFLAVGIYISGASRGCRHQPNLTPTWVRKQLRYGWRLLPITLGPQAACHPKFPRYGNDPVISPNPSGTYRQARKQGRREAARSVRAAQDLGISAGSTLWYDLEGFDTGNTRCRESALWFLNAWTNGTTKRGYVPGVYSSAASGIKALDDARVNRPGRFNLPERVWIADWNGRANTSSAYVREDGWRPGNRVKQYRGGHRETHGGVTINIDSNYLELGNGTRPRPAGRACGTRVNFPVYRVIKPSKPRPAQLRALQCFLRHKASYNGPVNGKYNRATRQAIREFRSTRPGGNGGHRWSRRNWMQLHGIGGTRVLKFGSNGHRVRRLQRVLNSGSNVRLDVTAVFDRDTERALEAYQKRVHLRADGIATGQEWRLLKRGTFRR